MIDGPEGEPKLEKLLRMANLLLHFQTTRRYKCQRMFRPNNFDNLIPDTFKSQAQELHEISQSVFCECPEISAIFVHNDYISYDFSLNFQMNGKPRFSLRIWKIREIGKKRDVEILFLIEGRDYDQSAHAQIKIHTHPTTIQKLKGKIPDYIYTIFLDSHRCQIPTSSSEILKNVLEKSGGNFEPFLDDFKIGLKFKIEN
jgi:hypothetical protein